MHTEQQRIREKGAVVREITTSKNYGPRIRCCGWSVIAYSCNLILVICAIQIFFSHYHMAYHMPMPMPRGGDIYQVHNMGGNLFILKWSNLHINIILGWFFPLLAPLGEGMIIWYANAPCSVSVHVVPSQVSQKTHTCGMVIVMRCYDVPWYQTQSNCKSPPDVLTKQIRVGWVTQRRDWVPPPS